MIGWNVPASLLCMHLWIFLLKVLISMLYISINQKTCSTIFSILISITPFLGNCSLFSLFSSVSSLLVLTMALWDCMTSMTHRQNQRQAIAVPALLFLRNLNSWLHFMLIQQMISFLQVAIQRKLPYTIFVVASTYICSVICINNPLMWLNLHITLQTCLLLHHLIVMSNCGIWGRRQVAPVIQPRAQGETWWFASPQTTFICWYRL